jgi:hypothetical protein
MNDERIKFKNSLNNVSLDDLCQNESAARDAGRMINTVAVCIILFVLYLWEWPAIIIGSIVVFFLSKISETIGHNLSAISEHIKERIAREHSASK